MAIDHGEMIISAGCFARPDGGAADLSIGTLCPDGVNVGFFEGADPPYARWNNSVVTTITYGNENNRKVTPYNGTDMLGKSVTLPNTAPAFRGVVIQQFNTELDDTNGNGTQVPVLVIKAQGFTYIAEPANVEEI